MNTYDDNFEIPAPDENVVCFYHEYEENGCFSNWYRAEFEYAGKRCPIRFNGLPVSDERCGQFG